MRNMRKLHPASPGEPLPDSAVPDSETGLVPEIQAPVRKKGDSRSIEAWIGQFDDLTELPYDRKEFAKVYYKSECRPLAELKVLHGDTLKEKAHKLNFRKWLDQRDRARKDLYWLGKECIGTPESGSGFVEHVHREMCGMFVQKNFDRLYHDGWTLDEARLHFNKLPRKKEALILTPTGSFKSTADKIDCVQWMLNFPDVRIFIITGSGALSRKFLREVKGFFYKPEGKALTRFQALFPEYVILASDGDTMAPLYSPARVHPQPGTPTLWVNSIDGTIAGWHCDVWKGDDIVNEGNSNGEDTRETLKNRYDNLISNRPDAWAFKDHIGTRYDPDDWYGTRIEEARKYPDTNEMEYLCRAAWTVKPEFANVPIKQLAEHMVDLYFPEFMSFRVLMTQCRQNEKNFRCQKLNQPAGADTAVHFDEETIQRHTILLSGVPRPENGIRQPVIIWDTAHEMKAQSDYSAGAVGWCEPIARALYVLEVRYGKWRDSQVAVELVDLHWKWNALFSEVEKFHGWELFGNEVQRVSQAKYRKFLPLAWRDAGQDFQGGKRNRVKGLESLLSSDRLWFVGGDWMETLTQQFVRFTGFSKTRKDDIPDAISGLQRLIPRELLPDPLALGETQEQRKKREAEELRQKFADNQKESAYRTVFPSVDLPVPHTEPVAAKPDPGPAWIFGDSGIHL
jgi:phage terminase large subunit-like protein